MPSGKMISSSEVQFSNARSPRDRSMGSSSIRFKRTQPEKAMRPIRVRREVPLTVSSHLHCSNAHSPTAAAESGSVMLVRRLLSFNAPRPISVIPSGRIKRLIFPVHSSSSPVPSVLKQLQQSSKICLTMDGSS